MVADTTTVDVPKQGHEELQVIWELEPGARVYDAMALPKPTDFDEPRVNLLIADDVRLERAIQDELRQRRLRELQVKERDLKHSLNTLISQSNCKLGEYHQRQAGGEDVARAIAEEEKRKETLIHRRDERLAEIQQAQHLVVRPPEVLGVAAVLPAPIAEDAEVAAAMARNDQVEAIAMEVATAYERAQGREPEDVSPRTWASTSAPSPPRPLDGRWGRGGGHPLHRGQGRAAVGGVALTRNEWIKAQRFGADYWLYIVVDCKAELQLYVLQNPAAVLRPEEELDVVRYIVRAMAWQRYARQVNV